MCVGDFLRGEEGASHLRHVVLLCLLLLLLLLLLNKQLLLLSTPGRPELFEAGLHFFQDFGGVSDNQLDAVFGSLEEFHRFLMVLPFHALKRQ